MPKSANAGKTGAFSVLCSLDRVQRHTIVSEVKKCIEMISQTFFKNQNLESQKTYLQQGKCQIYKSESAFKQAYSVHSNTTFLQNLLQSIHFLQQVQNFMGTKWKGFTLLSTDCTHLYTYDTSLTHFYGPATKKKQRNIKCVQEQWCDNNKQSRQYIKV